VEYCRGTTPTQAAEVASATKGRAVADGGYRGGGDKRAKAGDLPELPAACILITDAFNLVGDRLDLGLCLLPLLPQPIQQPAQVRTQVLLGIFNHGG
jgi:hypothetical protein